MKTIACSSVAWSLSTNNNYIATLPDGSKVNCGRRIIGDTIRYTELAATDMLGKDKTFHKFEGFVNMPKLPEFATFNM